MTSHRTIMTNMATAVRDNAAVLSYCKTNFGKGLAITVGAYPNGVPDAEDSPFLWIRPKEQNEEVQTDETFTVALVVGGCVKGTNGETVIENVITARTDNANGLTVNGGNKIVEDLRDTIVGVILSARNGAVISRIRRDENDISHFPLEWASFYVDFIEPESLTQN